MRDWLVYVRAASAVLALVWALAPLAASAADPFNRPVASATFTQTPPTLDGLLNDVEWEKGTLFTDFTLREPLEGGKPRQRTEARVLYDTNNLYVAFWAFDDEPEKIVAKQMTRDTTELRSEDRVGIVLDPLLSNRNGYLFLVTPRGARNDSLLDNGQRIGDWDGIWDAACHIGDEGYTCEIVIPFKTLNVDPEQTTWGFDLSRTTVRTGEWGIWGNYYQDVPISTLSHVGILQGLEGIQQGLGLDVRLNLATKYRNDGERRTFAEDIDGTGTVIDNGRAFSEVNPGFDAFYKLTPSLSLSATANTDFSDTEDDTRQVNSSRFSLFFPEKRRFFLQDFGVFDFGDMGSNPDVEREQLTQNSQPFFSRTIGLAEQQVIGPNGQPLVERIPIDILGGAKVSGRVGRFNVGFLTVQTAEQRVFDEALAEDGRVFRRVREIDQATLTAGRLSMNIFEESNLGLIFTHGDPARSQTFDASGTEIADSTGLEASTLFGFDVNLRSKQLIPNRTIDGRIWIQKSNNPRPLVRSDSSSTREWAWGARLEYPNDQLNWELGYRQTGASFRPALGFVNQQGIRRYDARVRVRHRPQSPKIKWIESDLNVFYTEQLNGNLLDSRLRWRLVRVETPIGDKVALQYLLDNTRFGAASRVLGVNIPSGRYTRAHAAILKFATSNARPVSVNGSLSYGGFLGGSGVSFSGGASWRPSPHFNVSVDYTHRSLDTGVGNPVLPPDSILPPALVPVPGMASCIATVYTPFCTGDETLVRIFSGRIEVNISPRVTWNTLIQYENQTENIGVNSRFRWIVEPGREIFLTLNQGLIYDGARGEVHRAVTEPRAKVSWLYRF